MVVEQGIAINAQFLKIYIALCGFHPFGQGIKGITRYYVDKFLTCCLIYDQFKRGLQRLFDCAMATPVKNNISSIVIKIFPGGDL